MKRSYKSIGLSRLIDSLTTHMVASIGYLFFKFVCSGRIYNSKEIDETLKNHNRFIIAMNHESYLDWIIIWAVFKYRYKINVIFLAKQKLFDHKFWGKIMRHSKCVCVSNEGSKIIDPKGKSRLENSIVGIFPEGTRSRDGKLLDFKSGVAVMAAKQNIPILPITLNGFYEAWQPQEKMPRRSNMNIVVNKLIENNTEYGIKDYLNLTKKRILTGQTSQNIECSEFSAAVCDLDSTLLKTNIASLLFFMHRKRKSKIQYILWLMKIGTLVPFLKIVDKFYRPLTQLLIYRMYTVYDHQTIKLDCKEYLDLKFKDKLICESYEIIQKLQKSKVTTFILSTNLQVFVDSVSERISAKGYGISLTYLESLSFLEKLVYLKTFKEVVISNLQLNNFIGFGDSKYDIPIFEKSDYSVNVNQSKNAGSYVKGVNNYIYVKAKTS